MKIVDITEEEKEMYDHYWFDIGTLYYTTKELEVRIEQLEDQIKLLLKNKEELK